MATPEAKPEADYLITEPSFKLEGTDLSIVASLLLRDTRRKLNRTTPGRTLQTTILGSDGNEWTAESRLEHKATLLRSEGGTIAEIITITTAFSEEIEDKTIHHSSSIRRVNAIEPLKPPVSTYAAALRARDILADIFDLRDPAVNAILAHEEYPPISSGFTPQERAILALVTHGLDNQNIAKELGIVEQTVKNHLTVVYKKLGAENRSHAIILAARRGLISLD